MWSIREDDARGIDCGKFNVDKKLAQVEHHFYSEHDVPAWSVHARNYLIGQKQRMKRFMAWIDSHGSVATAESEVEQLTIDRHIECCDLDYVQVLQ